MVFSSGLITGALPLLYAQMNFFENYQGAKFRNNAFSGQRPRQCKKKKADPLVRPPKSQLIKA
jgi:hypothetical protein